MTQSTQFWTQSTQFWFPFHFQHERLIEQNGRRIVQFQYDNLLFDLIIVRCGRNDKFDTGKISQEWQYDKFYFWF